MKKLSGNTKKKISRGISALSQAQQQQMEFQSQILAQIRDAVVVLDSQSRIAYWNAPAEKLYGIEASQVLGHSYDEFFTNEWYQPIDENDFRQALKQSGFWFGESTHVLKSGKRINVETTVTILRDNERHPTGSVAVIKDISARHIVNQELKQTRDFLENLVNYANAPIIVWDPQSRITLFNRAFERLTGLFANDVVGKQLDILFPQDNRTESMHYIELASVGEHWETVEIPIQRVDGTVRTVLWNSATLYDEDRKKVVATIAQGQDITERKKAERELKTYSDHLEELVNERTVSLTKANKDLNAEIVERIGVEKALVAEQKRFTDVLEMLPAYVILLTPDYHTYYANRQFKERFGEGNGKRCFEFLFQRDAPCENCQSYIPLQTNQPHQWEWTGPDNHIYAVHDYPFANDDGSRFILEMGVDITAQKQSQKALLKTQSELEVRVMERTRELKQTRDFLENLVNYANAPIIVWDPQLCITRFNHAFERLTGLSANDVIGKHLDILFPPDSQMESMKDIERTVEGEHWETVEIPIQRVDGTVRTVLWNSATLYDEDRKKVVATVAQGQDITERKQAEEELKQSETKYRTLFDLLPVGITVSDENGTIVETNEELLRILGTDPTGMRIDDKKWKRIRPDGTPLVPDEFASVRALKENRLVRGVEMGVVKNDGEITWISVDSTTIPHRDYKLLTVLTDITKSKEASAALQQSEKRYRSLFNTMNEGFAVYEVVYDSSGNLHDFRFLDINPAFEGLTGIKRGDLVGKNLREIWPDEYSNVVQQLHRAVIEGNPCIFQQHSGEPLRDYEVFAYKHATNQVASLYIDITERKKLDQLKDEFISMVSHEMRTPLTVIMGGLAILCEDWEKLPQKEIHEILRNAVIESEELSHILDNLLELSRYQAERLRMSFQPVEMREIVMRVISKFKNKSLHTFIFESGKDIPVFRADALRLERVLMNLLQNAVKYSDDGSEIRIVTYRQGNSVCVSVHDNGIGIRHEDQAKVFEMFGRIEKRRASGIGIGLVVCRRLIEAHDGKIWFESDEGKGSTFSFCIPLFDN